MSIVKIVAERNLSRNFKKEDSKLKVNIDGTSIKEDSDGKLYAYLKDILPDLGVTITEVDGEYTIGTDIDENYLEYISNKITLKDIITSTTVGSATKIPIITVNDKGLVTELDEVDLEESDPLFTAWLDTDPLEGLNQTISFNPLTGNLSISDGNAVSLDGRYSLLGHTHSISNIIGLQTALDGKESVFSKGSLVQGSNIILSGTLTSRLVGAGNITISADLTGYATETWVNSQGFLKGEDLDLSFNSSDGNLELVGIDTVNLDGRYSLIGHTHPISDIINLQTELTSLQSQIDSKENSFSKGNIVQGNGILASGTLLNRLVNSGNITFSIDEDYSDFTNYYTKTEIDSLITTIHDPLTIGTGNGLSLSGQVLSLALVTTSTAGAMSSADKSKLDGLSNYVHPTYTARSITASGAQVLSTFTSDTLGHVTDITTRTLTLSDLGYTPYTLPIATSSVLGGVIIGDNITVAGDGTISVATPYVHPTQTAISVTATGVDVMNAVTVNTLGHVTAFSKRTLPTASASVTGVLSSENWTTFNDKQAALVSGTNIKTINGMSILGSGDMTVGGVNIKNVGGTSQWITSDVNPDIRFEGTGDTSISFNATTRTITINSIPGAGGGGAVTSFNGRTGGVVSTVGDYNVDMLGDVSITSLVNLNILQYDSSITSWKNVILNTSIVPEGTNQYFTQSRARTSVSLTTTGNSGASTYNNSTGVFNIPNYTLSGLEGQPLNSILTSISGLSTSTTGLIKLTNGVASLDTSSYTTTARTLTINGTSGRISVTGGTQNLTDNRTWSVDLSTNGVAEGVYTKVTVDAYGRVTIGATMSLDENSDVTLTSSTVGDLIRYNGTEWVNWSPNYLTSNQTITLSGDVTGTGTTSIATTIANNAVSFSKIQDIPTLTLIGRYSTGTGDPQSITLGTGLSLNTSTGVLSASGTGGTVTNFTAGDLSPLFVTNVATATTTPVLSFTLSNAGSNTWFGNATGSSTTPTYNSLEALTKTDDSNVTLTLGGNPTTALLKSVSLTLGWTGFLSVARGGTGIGTLTGVVVGNGTSAMSGVSGTANQLLRRNAANTAYEFFTADYAPSSGSGNYIWNQNSSAQTGNAWVSGFLAAQGNLHAGRGASGVGDIYLGYLRTADSSGTIYFVTNAAANTIPTASIDRGSGLNNNFTLLNQGSGSLVINNGGTGSFLIQRASTTHFQMFSSNNFRIGGGSDNGFGKLQVAGAINQSSVINSLLKTDANGTLVAATQSDITNIIGTGNYVTTSTNQTGLTGNKTWSGLHIFNNAVRITTTAVDADGSAGSGNSIQQGISYWNTESFTNVPFSQGTLLNVKQDNFRHFQLFSSSAGGGAICYRPLHNTQDFGWRRLVDNYNPSTLSGGQLLQYNGTSWSNWSPTFLPGGSTNGINALGEAVDFDTLPKTSYYTQVNVSGTTNAPVGYTGGGFLSIAADNRIGGQMIMGRDPESWFVRGLDNFNYSTWGRIATREWVATFIGNGTLTLAVSSGLTGSASFTANQSGNSTFTVGLDADLVAIAALSGTSGLLRKTATDTWTLDTNTYSLSSHNHTLDSLSNVTITANSNGEILKWNGSAWINNTLAEASIANAVRTITTSGDGLTGGGDLTANRVISVASGYAIPTTTQIEDWNGASASGSFVSRINDEYNINGEKRWNERQVYKKYIVIGSESLTGLSSVTRSLEYDSNGSRYLLTSNSYKNTVGQIYGAFIDSTFNLDAPLLSIGTFKASGNGDPFDSFVPGAFTYKIKGGFFEWSTAQEFGNGTGYNTPLSWTTRMVLDKTGLLTIRSIQLTGSTSIEGYVWTATDNLGNGEWRVSTGGDPSVPLTRKLSINGVEYDLSADRSWTVDTSKWTTTGSNIYRNSRVFINMSSDVSLSNHGVYNATTVKVNGTVGVADHSSVGLNTTLANSGVYVRSNNNTHLSLYANSTLAYLALGGAITRFELGNGTTGIAHYISSGNTVIHNTTNTVVSPTYALVVHTNSDTANGLYVRGAIYATGEWSGTSDIRSKSDLKIIADPLEKLKQFKGYTFTRDGDLYGGHIAQEVMKVFPFAVTLQPNNLYSLNDRPILALHTEAIKALSERHENLEEKVIRLEKRIKDLENGITK